MSGSRVLVVTNDFPPRPGGIQAFVHALASRLPSDDVVVYASTWKGSDEFDRRQSFPVIRYPGGMMLPTPSVRRRSAEIARAEGCDSVWFGAAAPLGLLAPALRRAGIGKAVGSTHGHEVGWALLPAARQVLRRIARGLDVLTYLGDYTRSRLEPAVGPFVRLEQLSSGVDTTVFRPDARGADDVRRRHGLTGRPVVICVSRLVPRKGQDTLIRAMPRIRARVPDAALLIVGGGPYRKTLERLVADGGLDRHVVITGSVPWLELPAYYCAGDVFAMPCRTRLHGADVEGLGIVYLEASASGLPVVAGDSGGAPDAVVPGETGYVVRGGSEEAVAERVATLLEDRVLAARLGAHGRAWVEQRWQWDVMAQRLRAHLAGT